MTSINVYEFMERLEASGWKLRKSWYGALSLSCADANRLGSTYLFDTVLRHWGVHLPAADFMRLEMARAYEVPKTALRMRLEKLVAERDDLPADEEVDDEDDDYAEEE